jgi:hypothetical protein
VRICTRKKVVAQGPSIKIAIGFVLKIWLRFAKNGERLESPHLDRQFPTLRIELFGCFEASALAEAHARATAIFVDEFDATQSQRAL